ncbi:hypothetical protein ABZ714_21970 [Streptomyces sp. NPDC006798]|uniref:hypothetical protein n=1 Tax=Streptomyces sp. NPDC006798 TaxID=3155462 RepID=UPI0033E887B7
MAGESHWNPDSQRWEPGPEPASFRRYEAGDGDGPAAGGGGTAGPPPPPPEFPPVLPAPDTEPSIRIGGGEADDGEPPDPGRRAPVVAIVAAALAAVGIAATLWFTVGPGDEDGKPTAGSSASAAASSGESAPAPSASASDPASASDDPAFPSDEPSAGPSSSDSASTDTTTAPDGYRVTTDPEGFTLAVPEDWSRSTVGASVFYTSPDGTALVQIFEITEPGYTPADAVDYANKDLAGRAADYKARSVGPVTGGPENPSGDAAELVYAYDSAETGGVRECVERVFTATDYTIYAVLTCASAEQSPLERQVLDTALAHFEP